MTLGGSRALVASAACLALSASILTGCTSSPPEDPRPATEPADRPWAPSGPVVLGETDLGLKWNWSQVETAPFIESVGGGVTFHKTEWCAIEPTPGGPYQWEAVDAVVDRAVRLGYTPMLKIRVGSCWASSQSQSQDFDRFEGTTADPSSIPADLTAYSAYVGDFVSRYSARGVHHYAIENEIDAANFWRGPVSGYRELARQAAAAIRAADPQAVVLDGGVSSTGLGVAITSSLLDAGLSREALDFYSQYYARRQSAQVSRFPAAADVTALRAVLSGASAIRAQEAFRVTLALADEGVIDAYQLHFYESADLIPTILEWLRTALPPGFPIEAWETGVAWPGSTYDPQLHAEETARLLAGLLAEEVTPALYLPVAFTPGRGKTQVFRGLIEPDGTDLPAAAAYRTVRSFVDGDWQPLQIAGLHGIAEERDGTTRALVWTDDPADAWQVDDDRLRLIDLSGQDIPADSRAITHTPTVIETQLGINELRGALRPATT